MSIGFPNIVVFIRHGQSTGNVVSADDRSTADTANHRFPLTEHGKAQTTVTQEFLAKQFEAFDAFYVSTYLRTHQTMAILAPDCSPNSVIEDARLDEWWKGVWYEMPKHDVLRLYPEEVDIRERSGVYHYRAPGGESGADVECRIRSFLMDLRMNCSGKNVLVAAHGRWLFFLRKIIQNTPASEFTFDMRIPNCSATILRATHDTWQLTHIGAPLYDASDNPNA